MAVLIWLGLAVICIAKAMEEYGKEQIKKQEEKEPVYNYER